VIFILAFPRLYIGGVEALELFDLSLAAVAFAALILL